MFDAAEKAYREDVQFAQMVDCLRAILHHKEFTPSEMRGAAMLACFMHEERKSRVIVLTEAEFDAFQRAYWRYDCKQSTHSPNTEQTPNTEQN